jgi:hypothetical protein
MDEVMIFTENFQELTGSAAWGIATSLPSFDGFLCYAENLGEDGLGKAELEP